MNTAVVTPSGMLIPRAIVIMIRVPAIACRMPPELKGSSGPVWLISDVKKFEWTIAVMPRPKVKTTTTTRTSNSTTASECTITLTTRSRTAIFDSSNRTTME